jgi:hypothetical protein
MSKVPDEVLLPFKEPMTDRLDFDLAGLSPGCGLRTANGPSTRGNAEYMADKRILEMRDYCEFRSGC